MTTPSLPELPEGQRMGSAVINGQHIELRMHDDDAMTAYALSALAADRAATAPAYKHIDDNTDDATLLWAEIHHLRSALQGPAGFATWQDAATAERIRRIKAERQGTVPPIPTALSEHDKRALRGAAANLPLLSELPEPIDARIYWHASEGWQVEWLTPAPNGGQSNYYRQVTAQDCRGDGRCQYAIDHGAEGEGHCPKGKCRMPVVATEPAEPVKPVAQVVAVWPPVPRARSVDWINGYRPKAGDLLYLAAPLGAVAVDAAPQQNPDSVHQVGATPQAAAALGPMTELDQARKLVLEHRRASISLVQRYMRIGYNAAARLMDELEREGTVSGMNTTGVRSVLAPLPAPPAEAPKEQP